MGLWDFFSSDNERAAADDKIAGLRQGSQVANSALDTGLGNYTAAAGRANDYFTPLAGAANAGYGAYADATGAGGQAGLDRARTQFTQTPGYTEGLNRTLDEVQRRQASMGMNNSGNTLDALAHRTTDYADQNYGNYVSRLQPFLGQGSGIAGAQAGIETGVGQAGLQTGQQKANIGWNTETGIGNSNAAFELSKDQTGLNQLNGIFGAANLGSKLFGNFGGGFGGDFKSGQNA